ncbi:DUF1178 family protein [Desulfosarcina ovata]|uniref:Uncharacterized protein n=2 Tax=Desulfosarcina ovata TaxID=83564 RepID=A0A5K8ABB7_9BACT|nr:DUF1178 family protein [Desulfosarcina ovata]BBO82016.1 hypothetical protein DSCO28_25820 [Desulfosarcina ovata subsp. sediminis]BBO89240.1 hypothetical protein DSCOOX_24200 [Desulfosarcina ovata subsp. ovata]
MIAYDLQCSNGHRFEGWFEDSEAFERQKREGLVSCPVCEDTAVAKVPSTFAIKGASGNLPSDMREKIALAALGRQIVDFVEKNFDNVGADFAREALKMHYGASEPRNIRGVSTPQEEETLKAEGINFVKVPFPEKKSDDDPEPA